MKSATLLVGLLVCCTVGNVFALLSSTTTTTPMTPMSHSITTTSSSSSGRSLSRLLVLPPLRMQRNSREDEIRRKIMKLKQQGKMKKSSSSSSPSTSPAATGIPTDTSAYESKIKQKLGKQKSQLLGFIGDGDDENDDDDIANIEAELDAEDDDEEEEEEDNNDNNQRRGRIGYLPELQQQKAARDEASAAAAAAAASQSVASSSASSTDNKKKPIIDPSLFKEEPAVEKELSEEELLEKVAEKLAEKRRLEQIARDAEMEKLAAARKAKREKEEEEKAKASTTETGTTTSSDSSSSTTKPMTTGVGGKWIKDEAGAKKTETYKPKTGSWGAFERPKDISKAYGGGRRIGVGYSKEDDEASALKTKNLLKDYRRKVGIDVPSEKEHAKEIEEALQIGQLAMQRGVYATAVSALEKVTQWCSTNSPVGSKVYLELAMAYEAVGRSDEAIEVYKVLSKCRMEDVKYNAKRLLYGMEAMGMMREISSDFSRQKVKNTFIDATGLRDIAQNFDDRYNTAYVDLNSGFYKKLTESVVRSNREARQILLKAVGKGEVSRTRIVQALRSIARHFDDALEVEIETARRQQPTAYLDGKPLMAGPVSTAATASIGTNLDEYTLATPEQMLENLQGKWRLQLLADKTGDGVSFFNQTTAIQDIAADLSFSATGPFGLASVSNSGEITLDEKKRIISKENMKQTSGGGASGILGLFGGNKDAGFLGAISRQQQIISVDSVLLITKSPPGTRKGKDGEKEHFGVWRKLVDDGTGGIVEKKP